MKTTQSDKDVFLAKWLEGEISDSELKNLVSDEDYKAFIKIKAGIDVFVEVEKPLDATFKSIKEKIKVKTNKKPKGKIINLYAKIAIAVAASVVLFFSIQTLFLNTDVEYQSNFGEQQTIALLDGSEVILNAKSQLKYNKNDWKNNREVFLNGEAFFKVQKGSTFTVVTDNGRITVLGTEFNVNSHHKFFEVICYQGRVKVVNNNKKYILTPHKSIRNIHGTTFEENLNLRTIRPTWIDGESNFRSVPLSEVITALENQFNVKINSDSIDDSQLFTGSFDNKNIKVALASVFSAINMNYQIKNKSIYLSKN
ncbi:FecR family protein [uncultured Polaribacter sp.]|uniref:FecR family protein n=1 Tax=uncultured Polaribacter sp. TaxID=174711 RepID=UPI0030DAACEC|tara:strand:+ start:2710 stop:3642 length:933 start_codon:yes stop_codon:yes gene_type:complete